MALLIGGVSFDDQDKKLDRGVDVLIATPGRLLDHFERGKLLLTGVQILVIDEADRMLDMGFIPDIERICKLMPFTQPDAVLLGDHAARNPAPHRQFLHDPIRIEVVRPATTAETIDAVARSSAGRRAGRQARGAARSDPRRATLKNAIIFCNRKRDVAILAKSLQSMASTPARCMAISTSARAWRRWTPSATARSSFLVASDVAARGLDIPDVSHIFNFDVPIHADDYVHRIGRTGRAGRTGQAFMLVGGRDEKCFAAIEKLTGQTISRRTMDIYPVDETRSNRSHDRDRDRSRRGKKPDTQGRRPNGRPFHQAEAPAPRPAPPREIAAEPARKRHEGPKPSAHIAPEPRPGPSRDASELPAFLLRPIKLPALKPAKKAEASQREPVPTAERVSYAGDTGSAPLLRFLTHLSPKMAR